MGRGGRQGTHVLIAIVLLLASGSLASPLSQETHKPETIPLLEAKGPQDKDEAWVEDTLEAYAWSTQRTDTSVAPLVHAVAAHGWANDVLTAYREGHAHATQLIDDATRETLETRLTHLLDLAGPAAQTPLEIEAVPDAFVGPLATLLDAHHRTSTVPPQHEDPWKNTHQLAQRAAYALGAIDATLPRLHAAADETHIENPIALDPLGLVILGSHHDDTYDPHALGPYNWEGPLLVIEPGGNDTYNVPVATRGLTDQAGTLWSVNVGAWALELDGHDTYTKKTASADNWQLGLHLLIEEAGDDRYSTPNESRTLAHAQPGFAYLLSKEGNDTFEAWDRSLAHASSLTLTSHATIAILANYEGNDTYAKEVNSPNYGEAFGYALNAGAIAAFRDYGGEDYYQSNIVSFAWSNDDGQSLFWDDAGDDTYEGGMYLSGFGLRAPGAGGVFFSPVGESLAYFLDGGGGDQYSWDRRCCPSELEAGEGVFRVNTDPGYKWGIFVDCETPEESITLCPNQQQRVLEEIVAGELGEEGPTG